MRILTSGARACLVNATDATDNAHIRRRGIMDSVLRPMGIQESLSDLATELVGGEVAATLNRIADSMENIAVQLERLADAQEPPYRPRRWLGCRW